MTTETSASRKLIVTMKFSYFLPFVAAVFAAVLSTAGADRPHVVMASPLIKTCSVDDLPCLKESTKLFLNNTHMGIPAFDIIKIDPLSILALDVKIDGENLVYENRKVIVKGMKNQDLLDYNMDLKAKSVKLSTAVDLTVDGDVTEVSDSGKRGPRHSSSRGRVMGTVSYNYELKKDKGIEYFEVGPETISCQIIIPPTVQDDAELPPIDEHALHSHAGEMFCAVAKAAYVRAVHNIRAAARLVPAAAIINNIHGKVY